MTQSVIRIGNTNNRPPMIRPRMPCQVRRGAVEAEAVCPLAVSAETELVVALWSMKICTPGGSVIAYGCLAKITRTRKERHPPREGGRVPFNTSPDAYLLSM